MARPRKLVDEIERLNIKLVSELVLESSDIPLEDSNIETVEEVIEPLEERETIQFPTVTLPIKKGFGQLKEDLIRMIDFSNTTVRNPEEFIAYYNAYFNENVSNCTSCSDKLGSLVARFKRLIIDTK